MACSYDPNTLKGQPIGMFHCPECGEMVLAGQDHPDYDSIYDEIDGLDDGQATKETPNA